MTDLTMGSGLIRKQTFPESSATLRCSGDQSKVAFGLNNEVSGTNVVELTRSDHLGTPLRSLLYCSQPSQAERS